LNHVGEFNRIFPCQTPPIVHVRRKLLDSAQGKGFNQPLRTFIIEAQQEVRKINLL
jgi:hypothetical protein